MYCLYLQGKKVNRLSKQVTVIPGRQIRAGTVGGKKYTVTLRDDTKNACRSKTYRNVTGHMNCFRSVNQKVQLDATVCRHLFTAKS